MALEYLAMDATLLADEISISLYRLTPETAHNLIDSIRSHLEGNTIAALSAESQVLAALRFYATRCNQRPVGNKKSITMSQSSVSRSIHRVTDANNAKNFRPNVRFPPTQIERQAACTLFRTASHPFDGAIGAIDCAHVTIMGPPIHEEAFVNQHGYHSSNVRVICDPNLKILKAKARYSAARHDAFIWSACAVRNVMQRAFERGDHQTFLIGYANEVGEAFRPLVPRIFVRASYLAAIAYVCADTGDKSLKVHDRGGTPKQVGIKAGDVFIWQILASVCIPGFTINRITWISAKLLQSAKLHKTIVRTVPTAMGLAAIPIIVHPIDRLVDYIMDQTYRPFFNEKS